MESAQATYILFSVRVEFGRRWAAAVEKKGRVLALRLPFRDRGEAARWVRTVFPGSIPGGSRLLRYLRDSVRSYLGRGAPLGSFPLDLSPYTGFQKRVFSRVRRIPHGGRVSYRDVARTIGAPRAARSIGQALKKNRHLLLIPCHRVVRSDGALGGFTAPGGIRVKRFLLELERAVAGLD